MNKNIMISIIEKMAMGINLLIEKSRISSSNKIFVYGLDRYSFAIRTILSHRNLNVYAYVLEDEAEVIRQRRCVQDFACRYFRSEKDAIQILSLSEMVISDEMVILLAAKNYEDKKEVLLKLGLEEDKDFYCIYDFYDDEIDPVIEGKRRMTLPEVKETAKNMLKTLDQYCKNNNLRYWASGGTMLGTIRHGGFIPWDDDVDIFLPLKDYLFLVRNYPTGNRYSFEGFGKNGGGDYLEGFVRLIDHHTYLDHPIKIVRELTGVWIDIFPLVGMPEDSNDRRFFFRQYQEVEKSILQEFYAGDGNLNVFKRRFSELERLLSKYDFDSSVYVGVLGTQYGEKDCTRREVYEDTLRMKFEDIEINVPIGYDEYLSNLYGDDYMNLPPESKRRSLHEIRAFWAN